MWPDNWIICLVLALSHHWKLAQWHMNFVKSISKFCQILKESFQNGQMFLTVCQSGEISLNLVTLHLTWMTLEGPSMSILYCFLGDGFLWHHYSATIQIRLSRRQSVRKLSNSVVRRRWVTFSVTSKKSPNVYKSCPKMISLEKLKFLRNLQKNV